MKLLKAIILLIVFVILPSLSFAQTNWKHKTELHGKRFNSAIIVTFWNGDSINCFQDGFCDELLPGYAEKACYYGKLKETIRLLKFAEKESPFGISGDDEEKITNIRNFNKSYILVDSINKVIGTKAKRSIGPCSKKI